MNHKRVYRIYRAEGLAVRPRKRKRLKAARPRWRCRCAPIRSGRWTSRRMLWRADVLNGLAELERRAIPFDLCIKPRHLRHVPRLRDRCPRLKLVVDHLSKPPIATGRADEWKRDFEGVARLPNIWCKLSGLVTEADWNQWTPDELKPYVDLAVRQFGYDRVMFGTDWAVCTLAGSYQQVVEALGYALGPLTEANAAQVWGGNAAAFYQLRAQAPDFVRTQR